MTVKLIRLVVKGLHESYDYAVDFNQDVTFIYGTNGCGKTTILNITEAIITGQLYKLFDYRFRQIELSYASSSNITDVEYIKIENKKAELLIEFKHQLCTIKLEDSSDEIQQTDRSVRNVARYYFSRYPALEELRDTFNYVYLPLNRSATMYDFNDEYYMMRRYRNRIPFAAEMHFGENKRDPAMLQIESLIWTSYSKISSSISKINDNFRNSILKSLLEVHRDYDITNMMYEIMNQQNAISNLQVTRNAYIKMLKDLGLLTKSEEDNYNKFFEDFIQEFENLQRDGFNKFELGLVMKFQEISKIKKLLDLAGKMEYSKAAVRKPTETFLHTMNEFIENGADGKKIEIDSMGRIFFTTKYSNNPISIQNLSSGEKQLITFFSNLIFNVKSNSSGIFVVDEPELSLHLSWQKIFVEKTLELNKNIQLIFATHAPEIIGRRRDKMFKLEKQYAGTVE
ncbi:hypothetical protein ANACOL_02804 [Anaerotruncus colihominis DSM 17241]|uniref:Endonuclease GajA/Old nuclease/RecF-like AAA domain-containing protein n=1 Tax=Anaerotruncus colihominis DSM 17241 TaxID=445972 RepID=B0PE19_9FIRM|nr:hypothetical protein ANACOL_02804 [Anaerotruncus colihominis DSM 17241]